MLKIEPDYLVRRFPLAETNGCTLHRYSCPPGL